MRKSPMTVKYRRQRQGRTNYKKRLAQLKSGKLRLVVRQSLNHMSIQIVEYNPDGDVVKGSAHSMELQKLGWKGHSGNACAAYLTGLLLAKKVKNTFKSDLIFDTRKSRLTRESTVYAAAKGALEGGLSFSVDESVFPSDDRVNGKHIAAFAAKLKDSDDYERQFSGYKKRGLNPEQLPEHVNNVKKKITG